MLDRLGAELVRSIIALSREAGAAGARLSDRAYQADLGDDTQAAPQVGRAEQPDSALMEVEAMRDTDMGRALATLEAAIARLSPEARRELRAVAMIGSGDFAAKEWNAAVEQAEALSDASEARAMAEDPALGAHLSKGIYQLGLA